ncbi:MAG: DUF1990 family protein [Pirellulales bacterium]
MLYLRRPKSAALEQLLTDQAQRDFSYPDVGITRANAQVETAPSYVVDHTRIHLGRGEATFRAAIAAIENWQQFNLGWLETFPTDAPIEPGVTVAVVACVFGSWSAHCARIIYTIDDHAGPIHRFGFAYGTLPDHMEAGEERFQVEWNAANGEVHYDILAFSRPRHVLAKLGYPLVRRLQERFGRESAARMQTLTSS